MSSYDLNFQFIKSNNTVKLDNFFVSLMSDTKVTNINHNNGLVVIGSNNVVQVPNSPGKFATQSFYALTLIKIMCTLYSYINFALSTSCKV